MAPVVLGKYLIFFLSTSLCLYLLLTFIKFFHKTWWTPIRIQYIMGKQGIRGPSYKFLHGSTKDIIQLKNDTSIASTDLSHHIFPIIQPHIYTWIKLYGMNYLNWHGPQAQLIVSEPELVKEILKNRDGTYSKTAVQGYIKKLVGDGLATTGGEKWSKLRKLANHAFHGDSLKGMIPIMVVSVEMMLERWKDREGKEIEVFEEFKILTSEVISRTAFGSSYQEGENIFKMLMKIGLIIARNGQTIRIPGIGKFVKTSDDIESDNLEKGMRDAIVKMIKKREEKVMTGEVDSFGSDFLGLLVKAHHDSDNSKRISVDDMVDECKTFYFAGHETTTSLLSWTVLLLAIHTDWQERAREEVLELFGQQNPTLEGIAKLKNMSMIINESLRLYSPVVNIIRKVDKEVTLGTLLIPANIDLNIPNLALHHNPQIWGDDVHLFRPERFEQGVAKATNNNIAAFLPFGLGPRICVGLDFATTEAKIALSMILQHYKFTLSPTYVHSPVQFITTHPQHGVQILFQVL